MRVLKLIRLRIPAPRWPSKDPRDYRTVGPLAAWRARRERTDPVPAANDGRPGAARLPDLTTIVGVRRVDAMLRVELLAHSAVFDGKRPVLVRGRAGATPGAGAPDAPAGAGDDGRSWSMTLALN